ncbi:cellulose synthase [Nocardiopsis sp. RSe5-2]|uniref:Cellulose synthase n=1 Tax=Nocardiopsis endophytica TaxID=3018445 RepID=A0ABT4U2X5_9ACTN|nr:cellulose synthase [Nocardiopsis endophytica]MDA2811308.1 cellulose synthase [Nocardiopsis endophytica]
MLGAAITIVGLLISWVVWRRRGAAAGLRGVAWSLVPLAAGLLGLMATVWRAVADIVGILAGLLFNPMVWAGVAVAALAAVLFVVSGVMRAKGRGVRPGRGGGEQKPGKKAAEGGAAPGLEGGRGKKAGAGDDDMGDIEDLLRKHGIE